MTSNGLGVALHAEGRGFKYRTGTVIPHFFFL